MLTFNSFLSFYTQLEIELNNDYLISVKNLVIMDISLDKPGFSDVIVVEVHDASKSSGSSSASSGHPQRSCSRCPSRRSSFDRDRHLVRTRCRGYECSVDLRCEECESWSQEEMLAHEKYRKSLASKCKGKGRGKSSNKSSKVPASPPKTSAEIDLNSKFAAQYDQISLDIDAKMDKLSSSLLGQISSLITQFHHPNPLVSEDTSELPGYSGAHTEPEPPQPLDKSASARRRESLVREGSTRARVSDLAQAQLFSSDRVHKPRVAQPPVIQEGFSGVPSGSGGNAGGREHCGDDDEDVDDDDNDFEDRESVAGSPADGYFLRLVDYIYDRFPHSKPDTAASVKPRCGYEEFFSVSDPPEPARKFMKLYPRVSEIQSTSSERAARLSRESRPLFKILPLRRRAVSIGDDSDFCNQRFLNSDYSRICRSKLVPKSCTASINLRIWSAVRA